MSRFRVSIVDTTTGAQALLVPGGTGERDFVQAVVNAATAPGVVDAVVDAATARGIGVFRTEAQVQAAIAASLAEVHVRQAIEIGITEAMRALKTEVRPR